MLTEAVVIKDVYPYLRKRLMFARRTIYAAIAAFLVMAAVLSALSADPQAAATAGRTVFDMILWFMLVVGVFECIIGGASAVSSEHENKTVDLWVLAGMEHSGMVIAKALSVLVRTASTLIAPAVPAAVAIFMGGRSVADAQASFVAVISILVLSTAVSVTVSSGSQRTSASVPSSIAMVVLAAIGPWALLSLWAASGSAFADAILSFHPFRILGQVGEEKQAGYLWHAWLSLALTLGASFVLLTMAGGYLKVSRKVTRRACGPLVSLDRAFKKLAPAVFRLFRADGSNMRGNPVAWREKIALANSSGGLGSITVIDKLVMMALSAAAFVLVWTNRRWLGADFDDFVWILFFVFSGMSFLLQVGFAVRASQSFSREFDSGTMDLMRLSELDGESIVRGKFSALAHHYRPVVLLTAFWAVGWYWLAAYGGVLEEREASLAVFRPLSWPFAGMYVAAIGLMASLYFRSGIRSLYATAVIGYLVPLGAALALGVFLCPMMMMEMWLRVAVQVAVAFVVMIITAVWVYNYDRSRMYARQECLAVTIVAVAALTRLGGLLIGSIGVYFVVRTMMCREFDAFFKDEMLLTPTSLPETGSAGGGAYVFTHLGVPPSVESRLEGVFGRLAGRGIRRGDDAGGSGKAGAGETAHE